MSYSEQCSVSEGNIGRSNISNRNKMISLSYQFFIISRIDAICDPVSTRYFSIFLRDCRQFILLKLETYSKSMSFTTLKTIIRIGNTRIGTLLLSIISQLTQSRGTASVIYSKVCYSLIRCEVEQQGPFYRSESAKLDKLPKKQEKIVPNQSNVFELPFFGSRSVSLDRLCSLFLSRI